MNSVNSKEDYNLMNDSIILSAKEKNINDPIKITAESSLIKNDNNDTTIKIICDKMTKTDGDNKVINDYNSQKKRKTKTKR